MDRTDTMIAIDMTIVGTEMTLAPGENEATLQSQVRTLEEINASRQVQEVQTVVADQKGELVRDGIKMIRFTYFNTRLNYAFCSTSSLV